MDCCLTYYISAEILGTQAPLLVSVQGILVGSVPGLSKYCIRLGRMERQFLD